MRSHYARGLTLTCIGVLAITPDTLLVRLVDADPWTLVFWRGLGIATSLAVILWAVEGRAGMRNIVRFGWRQVLGAALMVIVSHCFIWALALTAAANVLVVLAGSPLAAALIGRIFLGEPVPYRTWVAAVVVAGGVAAIFADDLERGRLAGNLCAAGAVLGLAAYFVVLRSIRAVNTLPVPIWGNLAAAFAALPFASPFAVSQTATLWLVLMACVLMPVGIGLISTGPRYIPAAEVGLLLLLETLLGPLWVWLGTGEAPTAAVLAAGTVIVAALAMNSLLGLRSAARREMPP
ncbi:MAG: DMT family transporter [Alphaproteobacteria bacterium]|nr:DMT family transporter [Alphaproteobacteria bacterium]MCY4319235.1 DMT family transporter [Alphaproteobacteria bacterium]